MEGAAQASSSGVAASLTSTPATIFLVVALGLVVAGFLLRIVVKIFVGRRHRIAVDHDDFDNDPHAQESSDDRIADQRDGLSEQLSSRAVASKSGPHRPWQVSAERLNDAPDTAPLRMNRTSKRERRPIGVDPYESKWTDDKHRQRKWRNDPQRHESPSINPRESDRIDDRRRLDQPRHGSGGAGDELIDDLQSSLVAAGSNRTPSLLQDDSSDARGSRAADSSDEIIEREEALEQLRRSLDRLLQS
jgi:hypothetical protein